LLGWLVNHRYVTHDQSIVLIYTVFSTSHTYENGKKFCTMFP
jgi:hypothetical protein